MTGFREFFASKLGALFSRMKAASAFFDSIVSDPTYKDLMEDVAREGVDYILNPKGRKLDEVHSGRKAEEQQAATAATRAASTVIRELDKDPKELDDEASVAEAIFNLIAAVPVGIRYPVLLMVKRWLHQKHPHSFFAKTLIIGLEGADEAFRDHMARKGPVDKKSLDEAVRNLIKAAKRAATEPDMSKKTTGADSGAHDNGHDHGHGHAVEGGAHPPGGNAHPPPRETHIPDSGLSDLEMDALEVLMEGVEKEMFGDTAEGLFEGRAWRLDKGATLLRAFGAATLKKILPRPLKDENDEAYLARLASDKVVRGRFHAKLLREYKAWKLREDKGIEAEDGLDIADKIIKFQAVWAWITGRSRRGANRATARWPGIVRFAATVAVAFLGGHLLLFGLSAALVCYALRLSWLGAYGTYVLATTGGATAQFDAAVGALVAGLVLAIVVRLALRPLDSLWGAIRDLFLGPIKALKKKIQSATGVDVSEAPTEVVRFFWDRATTVLPVWAIATAVFIIVNGVSRPGVMSLPSGMVGSILVAGVFYYAWAEIMVRTRLNAYERDPVGYTVAEMGRWVDFMKAKSASLRMGRWGLSFAAGLAAVAFVVFAAKAVMHNDACGELATDNAAYVAKGEALGVARKSIWEDNPWLLESVKPGDTHAVREAKAKMARLYRQCIVKPVARN